MPKDLVVLQHSCIELLEFVFVIKTGETTVIVTCIPTLEVADAEVRDFSSAQIARDRRFEFQSLTVL